MVSSHAIQTEKIYGCIYKTVGIPTVLNKLTLGPTVHRLVNIHDKKIFKKLKKSQILG